jgi:hypothetical protein
MSRGVSFRDTGARYQSLRIIAVIFAMLGAILIALGTLGLGLAIFTLLGGTVGQTSPPDGTLVSRPISLWPLGTQMAWLVSLWSFALLMGGLESIATGVLLQLFINLEENTRATAQSLDKIRMRIESEGDEVARFFRS